LYRKFRDHIVRDLGLKLLTVEAAFGDRDHQLTADGLQHTVVFGENTIDVRVRSTTQNWLKENLWNIGARHLPQDCTYVLFSDADIRFHNPHIATEIVHALQDYKIVQPFETAADLGPDGEIFDVHRSFGYCHARGWTWRPVADGYGGYTSKKPVEHAFGNPWHPGFCLAMRRDLLDTLPILETGILGAGDHHMCGALIGKAALTLPKGINKNYKKQVLDWQDIASRVIAGNFGYVPGSISHSYHGTKQNRRYVSRWDILVTHDFDPTRDCRRNSYGVLELRDTVSPGLRDDIRRYFAARDEDA
jgi:hypothetical protein